MLDLELESAVTLAKSADATSKPKSFWYSEIRKHANRRRGPGQSVESAISKFIVDPDGAPLYKAMKLAKGPALGQTGAAGDPKPQTGRSGSDGDEDGGESEGMKTLRSIADKIREKHPELSKQQATVKALQTVEGARAALQERQNRLEKARRFSLTLG